MVNILASHCENRFYGEIDLANNHGKRDSTINNENNYELKNKENVRRVCMVRGIVPVADTF